MTSQPIQSRSNDQVDEQSEELAASKSKRGGRAIRRFANIGLMFCWNLNVMLLAFAFFWVYRDGRSHSVIELAKGLLTFDDGSWQVFASYGVATPVWTVFVAALIAGLTLAGMFCGLFLGAGPFRSVRMWLVFTAMAAGWLGFAVSWPEEWATAANVDAADASRSASWQIEHELAH